MTSSAAPGRLVTELLGFPPELLLDDMINVMHDTIDQALNAVFALLIAWVEHKEQQNGGRREDELRLEIDQGIIAFQTLLEAHVDIAADNFEVWALRNIFVLDKDDNERVQRHVVTPHHAGLDLDTPPGTESMQWAELDVLRRKIQNQRRLRVLLKAGVAASAVEAERSRRRLQQLSFLQYLIDDPNLDKLPENIHKLHATLHTLPSTEQTLQTAQQLSGGPRAWEASKAGYVQWAVNKVLERTRAGDEGLDVDTALERARKVASAQEVRAAVERLGGRVETGEDSMDE
ncbi:hypothetical protein EXIGLDRAFT_770076 [Exidia glandulosa HHB12029]|uniref:Mis12-domain-containing protein n=1 Tax=Exidia glandulosa HHB12029 TaxID=1314781 RepID=A0A165H0R8_EXIGL|nr:hypothetical protein EXIGLDRAFT_770076 [Exidia glandulosa HHB12029]